MATGKIHPQKLFAAGRVSGRSLALQEISPAKIPAPLLFLPSLPAPSRDTPPHTHTHTQIKVKGDLDRALRIASLISHERSKIYGATASSSSTGAAPGAGNTAQEQGYEREGHASRDDDYGSGAPAPVPTRARL